MGAQLVSAIVISHPRLSDRAFRVAVRMALSALDRPNERGQPAGLYFAGWEPLALVLGYELPPATDPETRKKRRNASENVRRAVRELILAGLVQPLGNAHRGSRQTYKLCLSPLTAAADGTANE